MEVPKVAVPKFQFLCLTKEHESYKFYLLYSSSTSASIIVIIVFTCFLRYEDI